MSKSTLVVIGVVFVGLGIAGTFEVVQAPGMQVFASMCSGGIIGLGLSYIVDALT